MRAAPAIIGAGEQLFEDKLLALAETHLAQRQDDRGLVRRMRVEVDRDQHDIARRRGGRVFDVADLYLRQDIGPDVRPVPGRAPTTMIYGRIQDALLQQVASSYLLNRQKQRSRLAPRTE